jgi:cysteinyl-tRNA synthetase
MTIELHNTLTRRVEPLVPIEPGHVRMYVCGMTVYDLCHLGHARTFIAFDLAVRWLRARGLRVTYVRNITDVEDKIIRRAAERGVTPAELTEDNIRAMHEDFAALGLLPPDLEPRATQYIPQMLDLIGLLEKKDLAYQSDADGDVVFAVRKFPGYGKLSGKSLDDLRAGERVAVDASKRDPLDFVLWKHAKTGEPQWPSRWGPGRPGWHIECSAMASETLGRTFDIHGGGPDLVFPHHENEIAQSEGAYEQPFARLWMHSGALRVGEEKMSKSLGNFLTIRAALAKYDAEVLRFFLVRSHYRSQIAFTESLIEDAKAGLTRLYTALRGLDVPDAEVDWNEIYAQRFAAAMDDDLNTALAVSVLFELAGEINRSRSVATAAQLKALGKVLGLLQRAPDDFLRGAATDDAARIDTLIAERAAAKKARDFATADRIRTELTAEGIVLEDSAAGTTWRRQ